MRLQPSCVQDCVRRMLVRDPSTRATAAEVLKHDWIKENGVAGDVEIEPEVRPCRPCPCKATSAALCGCQRRAGAYAQQLGCAKTVMRAHHQRKGGSSRA